ncbi:MAG: DUF4274 domain-containing protein [Dysgonomonas sp.]|nr:DUF4274 domain-containing protein [Dysgonomonas sp.]
MDARRKEYLNSIFREDPNLDLPKLSDLNTDDLHYIAGIANWDIQAPHLQWIVEQEHCSEATALMIFWMAQPQDYTSYKWDQNAKYDQDVYDLIKTIIVNFEKGFYKKSDIHYNPEIDIPTEDVIPTCMYQPTKGEEPYSIYDEAEIHSWFGDYFENQISRCDSTMDLYGIGCYISDPDKARLILDHPLCDKGVALMIFWRLNTYANTFIDGTTLKSELISKIESNEYPEILAYNPLKDKTVKVLKPKNKWEIPAKMKLSV